MPANVTLYASSLTWNGVTWNAAAGEALRLEYRHGGAARVEAPPGKPYPTFVVLAQPGCLARVTVPELKPAAQLGVRSDLSASLKGRTGQAPLTLKGMVLIGLAGAQEPGQPGACVLTFAHESADGVAAPVV